MYTKTITCRNLQKEGGKMFKVGDHVKGNEKSNTPEYDITNQNLIDAEVIEADEIENEIRIKCIRFLDGTAEHIGFTNWADADRFDYADGYGIPTGTVSSFVVNGEIYTNDQFVKDCSRYLASKESEDVPLKDAMKDILIVWQWVKDHPIVTNLDHYAEELGWTQEQKEKIGRLATPLPYFMESASKTMDKSQDWWLQEYQPKQNER
jgi:hypothetical protein